MGHCNNTFSGEVENKWGIYEETVSVNTLCC